MKFYNECINSCEEYMVGSLRDAVLVALLDRQEVDVEYE